MKIGLKKGDRIGIWSPNSAQWYLTMLAAAKVGLISVKFWFLILFTYFKCVKMSLFPRDYNNDFYVWFP